MSFEIILRKVAALTMSESDKLRFKIAHRGALEGYAEADWWRALDMDINFLENEYNKKTLQDIKRIFTAILKAIDVLREEIETLGKKAH